MKKIGRTEFDLKIRMQSFDLVTDFRYFCIFAAYNQLAFFKAKFIDIWKLFFEREMFFWGQAGIPGGGCRCPHQTPSI